MVRTFFLISAVAVLCAGPGRGQEALSLDRGRLRPWSERVDLVVDGAEPDGQVLIFLYQGTAEADLLQHQIDAKVANKLGSVRFLCDLSGAVPEAGRPLYVRAASMRDGQVVWSDFVELQGAPVLYLLVDPPVGHSLRRRQLLRYTPGASSVEMCFSGGSDRFATSQARGYALCQVPTGELVLLDERSQQKRAVPPLPPDERLLHLAHRTDLRSFFALIEKRDGGQRQLIVRLLECDTAQWRAQFSVCVISATDRVGDYLLDPGVEGERQRAVYVAQRSEGVIWQIYVEEPASRRTFRACARGDEIVSLRAVDDLLLAVTRPRLEAPEPGRLCIFDLESERQSSRALSARPRDFVVSRRDDGSWVAAVLEDQDLVELIEAGLGDERRSHFVRIPGARELCATWRAGAVCVLGEDRSTSPPHQALLSWIDLEQSAAQPVATAMPSLRAHDLGVIESADQTWIYAFDPSDPATMADDLWIWRSTAGGGLRDWSEPRRIPLQGPLHVALPR